MNGKDVYLTSQTHLFFWVPNPLYTHSMHIYEQKGLRFTPHSLNHMMNPCGIKI